MPIATKLELHIQQVKQVLEVLIYEAGLCLKLDKCKFFKFEARVWVV